MSNNTPANEAIIREFFRNQHMLMDYILCQVHHVHDAEDIFQEVAVIVCRKTEQVPDQAHFAVWCRGIARNLVKHYWRSKGRERISYWEDFYEEVDKAYAEADENMDVLNDQRHRMENCLEQLPAQSRTMLEAHYMAGKKIVDLARTLNRSADSIRMMLMRIRKVLQDCVAGSASVAEEVRHG
jgi:RNA polymerase sigma-70 factor (ECF subfamily)